MINQAKKDFDSDLISRDGMYCYTRKQWRDWDEEQKWANGDQ